MCHANVNEIISAMEGSLENALSNLFCFVQVQVSISSVR